MDVKILKSRYLLLIGLAFMNIFMFQNCSDWKAQVVLEDKVNALDSQERSGLTDSTTDTIVITIPQDCNADSEPINIGCPSGSTGTRQKVCVDGKYSDVGSCTPITCKNMNGTEISFGDSFNVTCADGMTGSITFECKAQDKVEEVARTCADPTTAWLCKDGDTKEVSCNSLLNKTNLLGSVLLTCNNTDHQSFQVPAGLQLSEVCSEIKCEGDLAIGATKTGSCGAGFDGSYVDVCTLNADGFSASLIRSSELSTCAPVVCPYNSRKLNYLAQVVVGCKSDEYGTGTTYVCTDPDDDKAIDGLGVLEFKSSDCLPKVCNADTRPSIVGKCADDPRFGKAYAGNIVMKCNTNSSAQDVEDISQCQKITCGDNLFFGDINPTPALCPIGEAGARVFICGAKSDNSSSANGDWIEDLTQSTCQPVQCVGDRRIDSTWIHNFEAAITSTKQDGTLTTVTESCSIYKKCQLNPTNNTVAIVDVGTKLCKKDTAVTCNLGEQKDVTNCGEEQSGMKWSECSDSAANTWTANTSQCKSTSCTVNLADTTFKLLNGESKTLYGVLSDTNHNTCANGTEYRCVSGVLKSVSRNGSNNTEVLSEVVSLSALAELKTSCVNATCSLPYEYAEINTEAQTFKCVNKNIDYCDQFVPNKNGRVKVANRKYKLVKSNGFNGVEGNGIVTITSELINSSVGLKNKKILFCGRFNFAGFAVKRNVLVVSDYSTGTIANAKNTRSKMSNHKLKVRENCEDPVNVTVGSPHAVAINSLGDLSCYTKAQSKKHSEWSIFLKWNQHEVDGDDDDVDADDSNDTNTNVNTTNTNTNNGNRGSNGHRS